NPLEHYLGWGLYERRPGTPQAEKSPWLPADPAQMRLPADVEIFAGARPACTDFHNVALFAHAASAQLFGGERSFLDLLEMLADGPYNVHVVVPRRDQAYIDIVARFATEVAHIPGQTWAVDRDPDLAVVAAIRAWLLQRRIALVHVNTITNCEPLLAVQRLGIPSATHVRESVVADQWISQRIGLAPADIIREVVERSDYIIANSPHSAAEFSKPGHTFVVPNTFDLECLDLPNPVDPRRIYVGLISSNILKKGLHEFAELARACATELPQLRFRLIGPHNEQVRILEQRQQAGELPANLEFVGYQDSPAAALAKINIVMSLSHFAESFGRTVAEGLAARRPAIVYDLGAVKDLVQQGQSGFVIPYGQWQAAIEPLRQLCADPQSIATMGEVGRTHIASRYARTHGAKALNDAYAAILAAHAERADDGKRDVVVPAFRYSRAQEAVLQAQRLAYFCWHFPVPSETFVLNELRELVARGADVRVYCRQSPHAGFAPDFPITWQQVATANELAERLQQDGRTIVHAHFTYPTVTEMVWPACERAQIPFTFIAHAQDIFKYENDRRNRVGELSASKWCRAVFVLGRFHRDYLIERGVPAAKIIINPNAIDPSQFKFIAPRVRAAGERKRVCAIHRFTEKKGLRYLVLAAKALEAEDIEFNLYGYGEEEAALRALVDEHAITNIQFKGALNGAAQVAEVMHQHDLFACPSVRTDSGDMDGIPTAVVEAMACGTPVITTSIASIPDLVVDGLTGIVVKPADPAALAEGILRFFALDAESVSAMTQAARQAAVSRHDVGKLASVLQRVWSDTPVDLVIVSWNNLPELREVVRRIFAYTRTPFHLTICDNASADEVVRFLCALQCAHDNVTVVYRRQNSFVGPGTNAAVAQGLAPYVIYLCGKEGFVLAEGWETELVSYMDQHPQVGVGGTLCYSPSYMTGADYPSIREFPRFREPEFAATNTSRMFHHVQGGLFIMRRRMLDEIGGFSDAVPHAYTDVEFSYYVEAKGWQLGQIPGMLALYNKTRPDLWSRVDESVRVIHPPRLIDLPLLDRIAGGTVRFCSVCEWSGEQFAGTEAACPQCLSLPEHRSLYRYLADGTSTYRKLQALMIGPLQAFSAKWNALFVGRELRHDECMQALAEGGALKIGDGSHSLVACLAFDATAEGSAALMREMARIVEPANGEIVLHAADCGDMESIKQLAESTGLELSEEVRYSSAVAGYSTRPLLVLRARSSTSGS
ncbi:MAG: glycosyltransferase, partial [Pseudomonadota bacterium]|nr:glycosyltransferase [Pseudomonadota bacterium]